MGVYEECPVLENENYLLRFVEYGDAPFLLSVYSDKKSVPLFNSDNCHGDDFYYESLERMQEAVMYWIREYEANSFVRWSVIDKKTKEVVGTIEVFHRKSQDYFNQCGLLRMDLRSDYETENCIGNLLGILVTPIYHLFKCKTIVTKAIPLAKERIKALKNMKFYLSDHKLLGHDSTVYENYWILLKD